MTFGDLSLTAARDTGAVRPAYVDAPGRPPLSLLRTGTALGFTVLALARPGYGASAGHDLSLGLSAAAYHLKAPAFAGQCAVARTRSHNDLTGE
ncbi:hypothetical protein [Actinomadura sp. KC345]|uniref:hypothetical protein n=1 Tax=Actinomadura sp. KC345 TaxID=2530371 RepID=UPI001A9FE2A4|nr:hypothetical protein [Actinomadura sp. KC345]